MKSLLWTVATICLIVWILGLFGIGDGMGLGNKIHILLIVGIGIVLFNILSELKSLN